MRVDDAGFLEFEPEIVAFAGALAHAGEHRDAAVLHGEVVDQFLNDDGLADARAAEQADLAAAEVGLEQIDDLDAGLEHFETRGLLFEGRRRAVNRVVQLGVHRTHLVHRLADHVEHAAERLRADRHHHRAPEADRLHAAHQALGGLQRDGAHAAFADVLLRFADDVDGVGHVEAFAGDADGGVDQRESALRGTRSPRPVRPPGPLCPITTPIVDVAIDIPLLRGGRAADHFDNFLGDAGLAHAVHVQRQLVDHVAGVGSGRVHRGHARGMLGGGRFQQRAVKLHLDVARQQRVPASRAGGCS